MMFVIKKSDKYWVVYWVSTIKYNISNIQDFDGNLGFIALKSHNSATKYFLIDIGWKELLHLNVQWLTEETKYKYKYLKINMIKNSFN